MYQTKDYSAPIQVWRIKYIERYQRVGGDYVYRQESVLDSLICIFRNRRHARKELEDLGFNRDSWWGNGFYTVYSDTLLFADVFGKKKAKKRMPNSSLVCGHSGYNGYDSPWRDSGGRQYLFQELRRLSDDDVRYRRQKRYSKIRKVFLNNDVKEKSRKYDRNWKTYGKKRKQWM